MYDANSVTHWLSEHQSPVTTEDYPVIRHYLNFYSLPTTGVSHEMGAIPVSDFEICVQRFRREDQNDNSKGTAFVLHGFVDHSGLQSKTVARLLEEGFDVVLYDQPGHGLSSGPRASIDSFQQYIDCLAACISLYSDAPGPFTLVGHSMGGAVSMTYMLQNPKVVEKAVLVAPLYRPRSWRLLRSLHFIGGKFVKTQRRRFVRNTRDDEFFRFIREVDPLSPRQIPMRWVTSMFDWVKAFDGLPEARARMLVVQGTDDGTVDWRGNMEVIRQKFPSVKIHLVHEGKHHLLNDLDEYSELAWDAIRPFLRGSS